ncbi:hypothetical protein [Acinetobacter rudis]|uniref:Uncharacterized protein n=1 Tax=Acinetobacter rudis CIP 110305 TaxID=421052 RepID=S3P029_9GAMM|nr:hypothetical protein [Acinetobacter rudis]EPF79739.1 hypothetical protein F945_00627 [Acinetobacter rudis CIP 110305]
MNDFILKWLKEYIAILVIIPATLGGIYQVINIWYYAGFSNIRYFSVSQVIPDGLIVIILLGWIIGNLLITKWLIDVVELSLLGVFKEINYVAYIVLSILWIVMFGYHFYKFESDSYINYMMVSFGCVNLISIGVYVLLYCGLNFFFNPSYQVVKGFTFIFFYCVLGFWGIKIEGNVEAFNNKIVNDSELYNYELLQEKTIKKFNNPSVKILYSNKDYIFYEININGVNRTFVDDAKELIPDSANLKSKN